MSTPLAKADAVSPPAHVDGPEAGDGHAHPPFLQHHFEDPAQQRDAATLGMWTFLGTEVMFFGGLIVSYIVYRFTSPDVWGAASRELLVNLATFNTVVLLSSSLTMALAVHAGEAGDRRLQVRWLLATMALGSLFLVIKGYEYYVDYEEHLIPGAHFDAEKVLRNLPASASSSALNTEERREAAETEKTAEVLTVPARQFKARRAQLFFVFYFFMTGLHAAHMIVGLVMLAVILRMANQGRFTADYFNPLEVAGLYWHFIDIVWVFLYPLLYLVALHR
jgi:cytochrome c oxidase subunit 3